MILSDATIKSLGILDPLIEERLNSFGYDLTLSTEFWLPELDSAFCSASQYNRLVTDDNVLDVPAKEIVFLDPNHISDDNFVKFENDFCVIPPHSFALGKSIERVRMPRDVIGICLGRSSYARCGIICHVTPLEPGWEGFVTIEITNSNSIPARIYANKGISQVIFFRGEMPSRDYVEKGGRYHNQSGIVISKGLEGDE